jgi:hypothetical protein
VVIDISREELAARRPILVEGPLQVSQGLLLFLLLPRLAPAREQTEHGLIGSLPF